MIDLKKYWSVFLLACLLFVAFSMRQCRKNASLLEENTSLQNYKKDVQHYKAKNGKLVEFNNALEIENSTLLNHNSELAATLENLKIKQPASITNTVTVTEIDSIFIPFEQPVDFCSDTFTANFHWADSKWIVISGNVNIDGVFIEQIFIENESLIVVGTKKNGLFKRDEYIVAVENTNPYIKVTKLEGYSIKPKPKFHDRAWFKVGLLGVGIFLGTMIK